MTYDLVIGDRAYSSWSLRGWLLFDAFGIPVKAHSARLYTDELPTLLKDYFPARTAPTMRTPNTAVLRAETIYEYHTPFQRMMPGKFTFRHKMDLAPRAGVPIALNP